MIRTDWEKGEYSPTSLQLYLKNPRAYYLNRIKEKSERENSAHLSWGTALHSGVASYYMTQGQDMSVRIKKAMEATAKSWADEKCTDTSIPSKTLATALSMICKYCTYYSGDTLIYNPLYVESENFVDMPGGSMLLVKIDRVYTTDTYTLIVDTKTTGKKLNEWFWKGFKNSFQMICYFYGVRALTGNADAIQIDAITTTGEFERRSFPVTEGMIKEFLNTYRRITSEIAYGAALPAAEREAFFYCNMEACGECPRRLECPCCL